MVLRLSRAKGQVRLRRGSISRRNGRCRGLLIRLRTLVAVLGDGWPPLRLRAIGVRAIDCADTGRSRAFDRGCHVRFGSRVSVRPRVHPLFIILVVLLLLLVSSSSHPDVTSDADTAALFRHDTAQRGTRRQPRELLGTVDGKRQRLDIETEVQVRVRCGWFHGIRRRQVVLNGERGIFICVLGILDLLIQAESQAI